MGSPISAEAGRPELASREPSAFALAIIAALTLAVSTDHLATAPAAPTAQEEAEAPAIERDITLDRASA
jgi:hypothetical protein